MASTAPPREPIACPVARAVAFRQAAPPRLDELLGGEHLLEATRAIATLEDAVGVHGGLPYHRTPQPQLS